MPQDVPAFEFSDEAKAPPRLRLRALVRPRSTARTCGPRTRAPASIAARSCRPTRSSSSGSSASSTRTAQNCNLLKFQPFSSYPSQVEVWIDGAFHSYAGCALESVAISKMPPFAGKDAARCKSYCACCLAPIELTATDGVVTPPDGRARAHQHHAVGLEQRRHRPPVRLDELRARRRHAERYERIVSRRGVLLTIEQTAMFVKATGDARMWDYDWAPATLNPKAVIFGMKQLGVDVERLDGRAEPRPGA